MSTLTVKVLESDLRCLEPLMPGTLEVCFCSPQPSAARRASCAPDLAAVRAVRGRGARVRFRT